MECKNRLKKTAGGTIRSRNHWKIHNKTLFKVANKKSQKRNIKLFPKRSKTPDFSPESRELLCFTSGHKRHCGVRNPFRFIYYLHPFVPEKLHVPNPPMLSVVSRLLFIWLGAFKAWGGPDWHETLQFPDPASFVQFRRRQTTLATGISSDGKYTGSE